MQIVRQRRGRVGIDMSPLIDCVFQLLIFFMLSSSLLTPVVPLTLPQAATGNPAEAPDVVVTVDAGGTFYVNGEPTGVDDLSDRLRPLLAGSVERVVTIRGDEQMAFRWFLRALDAARLAGAAHVNVAHRPLD
jgi:biopolymer transport protein ExbD